MLFFIHTLHVSLKKHEIIETCEDILIQMKVVDSMY